MSAALSNTATVVQNLTVEMVFGFFGVFCKERETKEIWGYQTEIQ